MKTNLPATPSTKKTAKRLFLFCVMLSFMATVFAQAPTISSFLPASGPVGTLVTINGTNLSTPTAFKIGGVTALVVNNSGTVLTGFVMPGAVTGTVSLTTSGGTATSSGSFTITATKFPGVQQGGELVGTGNTGAASQGYSVAVSADGNTAILGGFADNSKAGAVWIYTRSGGAWTQQGNKLVGTGNTGIAEQGISVALSADGNTAIVGGIEDNTNIGAVWVYTRSAGTWTQQGNKLVGTGNINASLQGCSVSLSADGNTAIVGGYFDNSQQGAAWVYTRSGGTWTQQGSKLVGTGGVGIQSQGASVALSADGNTAIVGGPGDNSGLGAAWVYTRTAGIWTQQGSKLLGTGNTGAANQGTAVSLGADGNTAVVGGDEDNNYVGAAWVYTRSAGAWSQQGGKLVGAGNTGVSGQGQSISLSADGNTAVIGGYADNTNQGGLWVYTRSGTTWAQRGSELTGTGNTGAANQGWSASLSADGSTVIAGGYTDNGSQGGAWVFTVAAAPTVTSFSPASGAVGTLVTISGTNLGNPTAFSIGGVTALVINNTGSVLTGFVMPGAVTGAVSLTTSGGTATGSGSFTVTSTLHPGAQQGGKLVGTGNTGAATQGYSVAVSADGNTAIVGGYQDNSSVGAAWVYTRSGGTWTQQGSKLVGTGNTGAAQQAVSVAISADGNTAIVGGNNDNSGVGAAWVYTRSGGTWSQQGGKLIGTGTTGLANQGGSVSLSADGNTAIVGGDADNGTQGAAWVYTRSGGTWSQQGSKLVGTGNIGAAWQGVSVSLSSDGNTAIVGGYNDNSGLGAAWVYTRSGATWSQQGSKLVGAGNTGAAQEGWSVSLSADGNTALVGGDFDNGNQGAAWVYTRSGGTWSQQGSKLVGTGNTGVSQQGFSVALSADGNTAIVGANLDNGDQGAGWVYTRSGSTWSQQGSKLVGTGNTGAAFQGYSVSLSGDGGTAIMGGPTDNSSQGGAWVFTVAAPPTITSFSPAAGPVGTLVTINGTNLGTPTGLSIGGVTALVVNVTGTVLTGFVMPGAVTGAVSFTSNGGTATGSGSFTVTATKFPSAQQGSKLVGTGNTGAASQGFAVAVSADGNTAIVGGDNDNSGVGVAWAYTRSGGAWSQQGSKLLGTGSTGAGAQGASVSISADGNTAIVGGSSDNGGVGAVWIYTRSQAGWSQQGAKLVATDNTGAASQGISVSLSADGNTAIVGGSTDNTSQGAAWIYTRSSGAWSQQGVKLVGTGNTGAAEQGISVSLSADGNTAMVGGYKDDSDLGAAWVYTRSGSTWSQQGGKLVGTGNTGEAIQGASVSLSADGNTAIVGGSNDNTGVGAAWVFTRSAGVWSQQGSKLVGTGTTGLANQGNSVSLSADGNTAIVAGSADNGQQGAAWVFTRSGSTWSQQGSKLVGTGNTGAANQAWSVSLSADATTVILGGPTDNSGLGAAWVFIAPASTNALLSVIKLTPASSLTNTGTSGTTTTYTTSVANTVASVTVTATAADPTATIKVNGVAVTSGTASGSITLAEGTVTTITTVVTAQNGTTTHTYSIAVTRAPSTNASLSIIKLTPAASLTNTGTVGTTTSYTTSVANATASVTLTPTAADANATIKVNGVVVASGTASGAIALAEGTTTTITTIVTAQDGTTTHTYSIAVTRAPSANATLSVIKLTPAASLTNTGTTGTTTTYTTSVVNATASVTLTPTAADANATIKVNGVAVASGTASGAIALAEGTTTNITAIVTSQDGTATHTYSITVTRGPSTNATLSVIKLTPAASLTNTGTTGTTTTYTTSVVNATASVTLTPTSTDANATIKINGVVVASGTASGAIALAEGTTTAITTIVTAQDGTTTHTYSITVTRGPSTNALLSVIKLTPASSLTNTGTSGTTTTYTTSVANAEASATLTPTSTDANAKIKVNGVAVASGTASGSITLAVGSNTITTIVTAQDGVTTHTYTITVTRAGTVASLYLPISVTQQTDAVGIENDGVMVHQGVSPNGDGINDVLAIDGIIQYPDNQLTIIDRTGALIFQRRGYNNISKAFDGHSSTNGRMLQPGTYFYSLDYNVNGETKHKTGFILLKY